jgi:hypothetical protein
VWLRFGDMQVQARSMVGRSGPVFIFLHVCGGRCRPRHGKNNCHSLSNDDSNSNSNNNLTAACSREDSEGSGDRGRHVPTCADLRFRIFQHRIMVWRRAWSSLDGP